MPKTITLRLEDEVYEALREHSEAEKRPLSNYIEMAALEYAKTKEFVDDEEMMAILSNRDLLERIRQGSKEAKKRRGRFVE
ncbi:MAG: CopG family transcriptional regulator [Deltaproteobacteria bacterium]|nr:CopG family transcriptional regulator [Deltaproteobacteria bacterium]